jgi:hypothetical protein
MKHLLKEFVKKEFPEISYSLLDLSHVNFFKVIFFFYFQRIDQTKY